MVRGAVLIVTPGSDESIAATGDGDDVLNERIRPDVGDQRFLTDPVARPINEELENRECARADLSRSVGLQQ